MWIFLFVSLSLGNLIHDWNALALRAANGSLPHASRSLAMLHVALYDSIISLFGEGRGYKYVIGDAPNVLNAYSEDAAIHGAAYTILHHEFPDSTLFDHLYASGLASLPVSLEVTNGLYVGIRVASNLLTDRFMDGTREYAIYAGSANFGKWRPTPPSYVPALVPQWATSRSWCLDNTSHFLINGPNASNLVFSEALRTMDEQMEALYWNSFALEAWYQVLGQKTLDSSNADAARLYCLLSLGLADALVASWANKYAHGLWRPITAIGSAWKPLLSTPNWPDYPSAYGTIAGLAAAFLEGEFPQSGSFQLNHGGNNVTYDSFQDAAYRQGESRFYGGISFNESVMAGLDLGQRLLQKVQTCLNQTPPTPYEIYVSGNKTYVLAFIVIFAILIGVSVFLIVRRRRRARIAREERSAYVNLVPQMETLRPNSISDF